MDYQDIRYTSEEHSAIITIDRPERMNAFRGRTVDELIQAFKRAWADPAVACVIFTGAGDRAFCAGGDQKEYAETGSYGTSENGLFEIEELHQVIRNVPKPVIAAVNCPGSSARRRGRRARVKSRIRLPCCAVPCGGRFGSLAGRVGSRPRG